MIVYKTASQMGTNDVFDNHEEYLSSNQVSNKEAHRIIDTDKVEALQGKEVEVVVDGWGNKKVVVNSQEFTITQFFRRYKY